MIACPAFAQDDPATIARQLESLNQSIAAMQGRLESSEDELGAANRKLARADRGVNRLSKEVGVLENDLLKSRAQLKGMVEKRKEATSELEMTRAQLRSQALAGLASPIGQPLKILLAQGNVAAYSRLSGYHHYLTKYRLRTIQRIEQTQEKLNLLAEKIDATTKTVSALLRNQKTALADMNALRETRLKLHQGIEKSVSSKRAALQEQQRRKQGLQELLSLIREKTRDMMQILPGEPDFSTLKGKLEHPVRGKLTQRFGQRKPNGQPATGNSYRPEKDAEVIAIAHGRVVYADWLRGYGLMLIVDHGDDYLSLYGDNHSLFKEVGDWVSAGELVARFQKSDDQSRLYFEIRYKGQAIDPGKWVR